MPPKPPSRPPLQQPPDGVDPELFAEVMGAIVTDVRDNQDGTLSAYPHRQEVLITQGLRPVIVGEVDVESRTAKPLASTQTF